MRLLDSGTCIEILRHNQAVIETRRNTQGFVATTWITLAELYYGAARSKNPGSNRERVDAFNETIEIVPFRRTTAKLFGVIKADLESKGNSLPDADLWIAALAKCTNAILVTGNIRDFRRIPGMRLENWINR